MRGHVDAESLALYAEGQLSRGRTARVARAPVRLPAVRHHRSPRWPR